MAIKLNHPADSISSQTIDGDLTLSGNGDGAVVVEGKLGVGTNAPATSVHIAGGSPQLCIQDDHDATSRFILEDRDFDWAILEKATDQGDPFIDINPKALNGTGLARIRFFRETDTTGNIAINICRGSNTTGTNASIGASNLDTFFSLVTGNFGIRSGSFGTSSVGVVSIGNGTAPTSSPANCVQLYARDVSSSSELFVRDEAGNATQLSPHATASLEEAFPGADNQSVPLPMVIHHRNDYIGYEEWIHLSQLAQAVEELTGKKFVYRRSTEKQNWDADQQRAHHEKQAKIDDWKARKTLWEATHKEPFDDEEPQPYEAANMPNWVRARTK